MRKTSTLVLCILLRLHKLYGKNYLKIAIPSEVHFLKSTKINVFLELSNMIRCGPEVKYRDTCAEGSLIARTM